MMVRDARRDAIDLGPAPASMSRVHGRLAVPESPLVVNRLAQRRHRAAQEPRIRREAASVRCAVCGAPCVQSGSRPRLYCGQRCRQRAYVARTVAA